MHANVSNLKKSLHLLPVIPVYIIVLTVIYGYTKYFLFDFLSSSTYIPENILIKPNIFFLFLRYSSIILFYTCASMTILCHVFSMFSNPGENPFTTKEPETKIINQELFCKKCQLLRPERSHHCKACEKCILKMDHHCPWVANCVGLKNLKYFVLFLFYATLGDFIAFISLFPKVFYIDIEQTLKNVLKKDTTHWDILSALKDPLFCIISAILAFFMASSIGLLLCFQVYNIFKNMTTIEHKIYADKETPYKYEKYKDNFISVFGKNIFLWFIPVYHFDNFYNVKKEKNLPNYLSLCDMEEQNNMNIDLQEI